jgi:hypothetical protein
MKVVTTTYVCDQCRCPVNPGGAATIAKTDCDGQQYHLCHRCRHQGWTFTPKIAEVDGRIWRYMLEKRDGGPVMPKSRRKGRGGP